MSAVTISTVGSKVHAVTPYNTLFVAAARRLAGTWHAPTWVFDARDEDRVRKMCMKYFGSDGRLIDTCTVRVVLDETVSSSRAPITLNGRPIAAALDRDSGARIGENVVLLEGSFGSGGSRNHWTTCVKRGGATVLLRDFPRAAALSLIETPRAGFTVTLEEEVAPINVSELMHEREKLTARIAEIDALIERASSEVPRPTE